MRFHRRSARRLRGLALGLGAVALLAPAGAVAKPPQDVPAPAPGAQAKVGDTPADFPTGARSSEQRAQARIGDTPADFPGASRAPQYQPPVTVEVVRPERTVIRDTDEELPIVLASLAVLIAIGGTALALVRTRAPRGRATH
jgi:hypothetical protein